MACRNVSARDAGKPGEGTLPSSWLGYGRRKGLIHGDTCQLLPYRRDEASTRPEGCVSERIEYAGNNLCRRAHDGLDREIFVFKNLATLHHALITRSVLLLFHIRSYPFAWASLARREGVLFFPRALQTRSRA